MELLKTFSTNYANAFIALVGFGALVLASITLWFLKREFSAKYRPYVFPVVDTEPIHKSLGCTVSIVPRNVGPHPCNFKLSKIRLHIGDETYDTPDSKEWMLLPPQGICIRMPAGNVNDNGVMKIREGRYKKNRIELSFCLHTKSIENKFTKVQSFSYEINVLGEKPLALHRAEWVTNA